jgi:hypothetical protein
VTVIMQFVIIKNLITKVAQQAVTKERDNWLQFSVCVELCEMENQNLGPGYILLVRHVQLDCGLHVNQ